MITPYGRENAKSASAPASNLQFPNYAPPPANPQGIPFQGEKYHKPLFGMIKQMQKKSPSKPHKGLVKSDRVKISHKRKQKFY